MTPVEDTSTSSAAQPMAAAAAAHMRYGEHATMSVGVSEVLNLPGDGLDAAAEQARALENGLPNGQMELRTERVEILLPQADLRLIAQNVKLSGLIAVGMAGEER